MNKKDKALKAYGYVRSSFKNPDGESISLKLQKDKIKAFADLMDLELVGIIQDIGISGRDLKREGLQKLLKLIEAKECEAVIVYKLDRLSRNTLDLLSLMEDVFKDNVRFFSLAENIDTESALGHFFLTVIGAMAQMEREVTSERTKFALEKKKQKGDSLGHIPYGYTRNRRNLEVKPEEKKDNFPDEENEKSREKLWENSRRAE